MATNLKQFTFSAASADLTGTGAYNLSKMLQIGSDGPSSETYIGDQLLGIVAGYSTGTGADGTLWLQLVDNNAGTHKVVATYPCTLTAQARRTNLANTAANGYTLKAVWDESGTRWIDLSGMAKQYDAVTAASGATAATGGTLGTLTTSPNPLEWYLICQGLGGLTAVTIWVASTRTI